MSKARTWTCQRVKAGERCGRQWPRTKARCECGGRRPAPRPPAHMRVLDVPYEQWVELFGDVCGICGQPPKEGKRLHRDHVHRDKGEMRGLLCFQCNRMLGNKPLSFMRPAAAYMERHERRTGAAGGVYRLGHMDEGREAA